MVVPSGELPSLEDAEETVAVVHLLSAVQVVAGLLSTVINESGGDAGPRVCVKTQLVGAGAWADTDLGSPGLRRARPRREGV